jgi:hypothetical protein
MEGVQVVQRAHGVDGDIGVASRAGGSHRHGGRVADQQCGRPAVANRHGEAMSGSSPKTVASPMNASERLST